MFDPSDPGPEYELDWPRDLFAAEGAALLQLPSAGVAEWTEIARLLLAEAFCDETASLDLGAAALGTPLPEELVSFGEEGVCAARS